MTGQRLLITGANGFVGCHVLAALRRRAMPELVVLATARVASDDTVFGHFEALDVEDGAAIARVLDHFKPTHVLHLAGISSPVVTGGDPLAIWRVNTEATLRLAHALLDRAPQCWLLFAGSGLVYGTTANSSASLTEECVLSPTNAYAATKAAADLALGALAQSKLKVVRFRPFNHTGAGQTENFAVPAFAAQIARIEAKLAPPVIQVGDLSAERDLLDVTDVVAAYLDTMLVSDRLEPGVILNVASGVPRRMQTVLDALLAQSRVTIEVARSLM